MSYLLLAVGALMAAIGLYLAVTGYGIVQAEVGWSSFIAGTTLLAGGIVTMALGVVLYSLTRLLRDHSVDRPPIPAIKDRDAAREEPIIPAPVPVLGDKAGDDRAGDDKDDKAPSPLEDLPLSAASLRRDERKTPDDSYRLETPSTPEHDLIEADTQPETPPKTPPKTTGDWLDRTFAALDRDSRPFAPKRASRFRSSGETASDKSVAPAPVPEPALADAEPQDAPLADPAQAPTTVSNTSSSVIGRYEADGTSYVMYADGSIEAQTHGGIYRFASMAELKAFIES